MTSVQSSRAVILNAAIVHFARKGYAGTGVQEILAGVKLSKPTLYYHFESKAGLFRAIVDHAYDEIHRLMITSVREASGLRSKLIAGAEALFSFTKANQDLTRLVFSTVFAAPEEIPPNLLNPAKRRRNLAILEKVLQQAQKSGEIDSDYTLSDLSHGIYGSVSQRVRTYLLTGEGELDRATAERTVTLFLQGALRK